MNKIILFIALSCVVSISVCAQEAQEYWHDKVVKTTLGQTYVSFQVEKKLYTRYQGEVSPEPEQVYTPWRFWAVPQTILMDDGFMRTMLVPDSLFICYYQEGNYSYGCLANATTQYEVNTINDLIPRLFRNMETLIGFYLVPSAELMFQKDFFSIEPTDDGLGHQLSYAEQKPWIDSKGNSRTECDTITYYVDDASGHIYRIREVNDYNDGGAFIKVYDITHLSFEQQPLDLSLFRKTKQTDPSFSYFNINNPQEHNPSDGLIYVENEDVDRLLDAHLIGIGGRDTTLRDFKGWVLVDIWSFGCRPCIRFANRMSAEKDSLGYRVLEHEGVSVVCINPTSKLTDHLANYAREHDIADICYSGNQIIGSINWFSTPYYLLLSPKGEILFRGNDLGDNYEKILKIVR